MNKQPREDEIDELKAYIAFYATNIWGISLDDPVHPLNVISAADLSPSELLSGLRQAVNDTVADSAPFNAEAIKVVDEACRASQVLTLSEVRRRYSAKYKRILKNKKISNQADYYLVSGVLNDMSGFIGQSERLELERIVSDYEENTSQRKH